MYYLVTFLVCTCAIGPAATMSRFWFRLGCRHAGVGVTTSLQGPEYTLILFWSRSKVFFKSGEYFESWSPKSQRPVFTIIIIFSLKIMQTSWVYVSKRHCTSCKLSNILIRKLLALNKPTYNDNKPAVHTAKHVRIFFTEGSNQNVDLHAHTIGFTVANFFYLTLLLHQSHSVGILDDRFPCLLVHLLVPCFLCLAPLSTNFHSYWWQPI